MRQHVWGEHVALYVAERTGVHFVAPYAAFGVEIDGQVVGGVVFNNWVGADICVTVAGETCAWSRRFLIEVGQHVFSVLRCERMTALTEQPRVVRFGEWLGGKVEGRLRNYFGAGRDATVLGILKSEWVFA